MRKRLLSALTALCTAVSCAAPMISRAEDLDIGITAFDNYLITNNEVSESNEQYSFDVINNMTEDELKALYTEKGLTDDKGYTVWTKDSMAEYLKTYYEGKSNKFALFVLIKTEPKFITSEGKEIINEAYTSNLDKFFEIMSDSNAERELMEAGRKKIGLPEDLFGVMNSHCSVKVEADNKGDSINRRYLCYNISPLSSDSDKSLKLMAAAMNYLQLNPAFDSIKHYSSAMGSSDSTVTNDETINVPENAVKDYIGEVVFKVVSYPQKTTYTVGENLELSGISVMCHSETFWYTADNSNKGVIYGEPYTVDNITLDAKNAWIYDNSGINTRAIKGDMFNTLKSGTYQVAYGDIYRNGDTEIKFCDFVYDITIKDKLENEELYMSFLNGEYWQMNEGETSLARVFGYEDSKEYKDGESPLTFKITDENIAVIKNINGPRVVLYAKSKGETTLTVTAPDGRTTTARVVVDEALPTTTTTARIDNTETTTTTVEKKDLYMEFLNGEYWQMNEGETSLARVFGYEDSKEYKDGESPLTFKIADESIAVIKNINGPRVELYAKSKGETTLTVTAPDGRTTTARVVVDEALPTTTTTVRINDTETTTTTVKIDYRVQVEYDKSPMKTGEKREVKFYNPETKTAKNGKVNTSSDCISIDYEEGKDTFTVTALKEGKAEIYITAEGCTFGSYVYLDIISSEAVKGDANCDGQLDMADAVLIMQALANPNKYGLGGTAEIHLTEQGKLNGDMDGDGLTVGDAQAIQKILLGLK